MHGAKVKKNDDDDIMHLVGYFQSCITMHGFTNIEFIRSFINA
jgi:hypothetical protein